MNITELIAAQNAAYDPTYPQWSVPALAALNASRAHLDGLQRAGHPKFCSEQRWAEADAAVRYYANSSVFDASFALLAQSLRSPDADNQSWALAEQPGGTWGPCYTVEPLVAFNRLDPFINAWSAAAASAPPAPPARAPVHALDPWLGGGLVDYCRAHLVSHIGRDGVNAREMLAAVSGDLCQMAFKAEMRALWNASSGAAPLTDAWVEAWWSFLGEWQDPATGTWGARYSYSNATDDGAAAGGALVAQAHDLSMTYHILSYSHKGHRHAARLYPELHGWLLSPGFLQDGVYPLGRLYHGRPCAHNDYDVARLWELVLPSVPNATARKVAAAWVVDATAATLSDQLGAADFVFEARMGSLFDAQYFGVALLSKVGYFNASERWWAADFGQAAADALWPEAAQTCCGICGALTKMGMGLQGALSTATWALLQVGCPACVPAML